MKTRGSLTPLMTLCKWFEYIEKFKLYHYQNYLHIVTLTLYY
jgi:hypothetical protein